MIPYNEFLQSKIKLAKNFGFKSAEKNPHLLPHAQDIVQWGLAGGRRLIAASFGLTKTRIQIDIAQKIIKHYSSWYLQDSDSTLTNSTTRFLIIAPLNVKYQFVDEDGKEMGVHIQYVRNTEEFILSTSPICITNYERVRDGNFDIDLLMREYGLKGVSLDEGSVLRSLGSQTTQQFINLFKDIPFKFVATATPDPNDYLELINYAVFLGICDRGWALTRFFQRDSQKAGNLKLHPQHEQDFWLWVKSWAIFITRPSDLGYPDTGYDLPKLNVIWHELDVDPSTYGELKEKDGQLKMYANAAKSIPEAAKIKRATIKQRLDKAISIINNEDHYLLWHVLEPERFAINKYIPEAVTIYGKQDIDLREQNVLDFTRGKIRILASKPELSGSGCNFQRHCNNAIFISLNDKFNDIIQAVHRIYRFLQTKEVNIHMIYALEEKKIVDRTIKKWERYDKQIAKMRELLIKYGLDHTSEIENIKRSFGVKRREMKGLHWCQINNDNVLELPNIPDNSVGLIHTSIPFGNHYSYTFTYNDFGHNDTNEIFWQQMDYLIPELYRVLKPGRCAIIHVKDRIRYGNMTGYGRYTTDGFSDECAVAFTKHGFLRLGGGRITIPTDVVRENNQTYRLGHSETLKDGSKMGTGLPEYLICLFKPQTDRSKGYADEPVRKTKDELKLGVHQLDSHSVWRSNGNRPMMPEDLARWDIKQIQAWLKNWGMTKLYDYEFHKKLADILADKDKLPKDYASMVVPSNNEYVWDNVHHFHGLNVEQDKNRAQKHICPLPFDIVNRTIDKWSNKGDLILDPFGGLGTVGYCAIKKGRQAICIELNPTYHDWAVKYLKAAEAEVSTPTLFDVIAEEDKAKERMAV